MSEVVIQRVSCAQCGYELEPEWPSLSPRPPCPNCSGAGIKVEISAAVTMAVKSSVETTLMPAPSPAGWKQKWEQIQASMKALDQPISATLSSSEVKQARERLMAFFVQAYHLRDALIEDQSTNLTASAVETAMKAKGDLALLRDLAILVKHATVNSNTWSNAVPCIGNGKGTATDQSNGWTLKVDIVHGGQIIDGVDVARRAVSAWQALLQQEQLL